MKFFTSLFVILFFYSKIVYSNDIFDTSFYDIEFESENIDRDKLIKINEIKIESLTNIFKKILIKNDYFIINKNLSDELINFFIKNIIINEEKIIDNKYYSKIKINYNKRKIVQYLIEKKISYIGYYPNKILLIIHENNKLNDDLFSNNNKFYSYFLQNIKDHKLFVLPNLDINDRFLLTKEDLSNQNISKIEKFSKKYNTNDLAVITVKINNNIIEYNLLFYSDGIFFEKNFNSYKNDLDNFFNQAELEILEVWKEINKIQNNTTSILRCKLNYYNLSELKEIRRKLENITIIDDMYIRSLSYKNIEYDIYYYGNLKILSKLFDLNYLKIKNIDNDCILGLQ